MHEATDDRRRELGTSHASKVAQLCHIDRAKLRNGCVNSRRQGGQHWRDVACEQFLTFRLNRRELFRRECVAAGVGEEAIDDAGNVTHMKGRRGCPCRTGVPFLLRQRLGNLGDTLANLKKDVRDWLQEVGNAVDRPALPPFSLRHSTSARRQANPVGATLGWQYINRLVNLGAHLRAH